MRKDRALLDESTKKNELEIMKYRQKEESMKTQLREINRERAVLRKEREDVWQRQLSDLNDYERKIVERDH